MTESNAPMNGSAPEPTEADLIGDAVAGRLGALLGNVLPQVFNMLPPMLGQAVAQSLQQGQPRRWCVQCLTQRLQWEGRHTADMEAALELAAKAAGIPEGDPRRGQIDVTPFLPERLRAGAVPEGMPQLSDGVTIAGGNLVCPMHVPGGPGTRGRSLIIPPPGMPVSMAVALAGQPG